VRILICEDHDSIRKMIETLMLARGHEVVGVSSGTKAVDRARAEAFDVLLLDLMLPGTVDGFAVCRTLRADEATAHLPIIVLSAMDDDDARQRALEAGATAFQTKPFRSKELLRELERISVSLKARPSV
jgi:CheY-like chemotaxis protein